MEFQHKDLPAEVKVPQIFNDNFEVLERMTASELPLNAVFWSMKVLQILCGFASAFEKGLESTAHLPDTGYQSLHKQDLIGFERRH